MRKINSVKIERSNLLLQNLFGFTILFACFTSKALMLAAAAIGLVYSLGNATWAQKISFFMFALSFSVVFKFSPEQTSLFMFLKLAVIFAFIFQQKQKLDSKFLLLLLLAYVYCVTISIFRKTSFFVPTLNLVLWILVGYVIFRTISVKNSTPVARSLSNGIIITGIIGLFIEQIPQLRSVVSIIQAAVQGGVYVTRHAGLMVDPNFFTVMIIASLWFIYYEFNSEKISISEFITRCVTSTFLGFMTMSKSCAILLIFFWFFVLIAKNNLNTTAKSILLFSLVITVMIFVWRNPYWFSDITYRFTLGNDEITADVITTGRASLWEEYFKKITTGANGIFGYGFGAELVGNKASHNTIIQLIYNLGIFGSVLLLGLFRNIYRSSFKNPFAHRADKVSKYMFFSLISTLMFLDGLYFEQFYYVLFMCFVYMSGEERSDILSE